MYALSNHQLVDDHYSCVNRAVGAILQCSMSLWDMGAWTIASHAYLIVEVPQPVVFEIIAGVERRWFG